MGQFLSRVGLGRAGSEVSRQGLPGLLPVALRFGRLVCRRWRNARPGEISGPWRGVWLGCSGTRPMLAEYQVAEGRFRRACLVAVLANDLAKDTLGRQFGCSRG